MNSFERGMDPKKAMEIGLDQVLKNKGIIFDRNFKGEGRFHKSSWDNGLEVSSWTSAELRLIADYIEANPDCKKIIIDEFLIPEDVPLVLDSSISIRFGDNDPIC
jgi:hypothetical protein